MVVPKEKKDDWDSPFLMKNLKKDSIKIQHTFEMMMITFVL